VRPDDAFVLCDFVAAVDECDGQRFGVVVCESDECFEKAGLACFVQADEGDDLAVDVAASVREALIALEADSGAPHVSKPCRV
jgi:hypothetical protein